MQTRSSPNIQTLHSLARQAAIPCYETLSKTNLFVKLKEQYDFDRLQRIENRRQRISEKNITGKKRKIEEVSTVPNTSEPRIESSCSNGSVPDNTVKSKIKPRLNKIDPIMFAPIKKTRSYKIVRPNGNAIAFNIDTLIDYISKTGDFNDPVTRIPLSDDDLKDIDAKAIKLKLNKPSLYELKKNPAAFADFKFRRDALCGLERCAGEVVSEILEICESNDPEEAQMRLMLTALPTFGDYYRQLRDADSAFAAQCMSHWRSFLEGPPNKPNYDEYGLIEVVRSFFKTCDIPTAAYSHLSSHSHINPISIHPFNSISPHFNEYPNGTIRVNSTNNASVQTNFPSHGHSSAAANNMNPGLPSNPNSSSSTTALERSFTTTSSSGMRGISTTATSRFDIEVSLGLFNVGFDFGTVSSNTSNNMHFHNEIEDDYDDSSNVDNSDDVFSEENTIKLKVDNEIISNVESISANSESMGSQLNTSNSSEFQSSSSAIVTDNNDLSVQRMLKDEDANTGVNSDNDNAIIHSNDSGVENNNIENVPNAFVSDQPESASEITETVEINLQ